VLRTVAAALVVAAALTAAAPAATTPNVRGVIAIPRSDVCPPDEPCDPTGASGSLVFWRAGKVAARAELAPTGRFALRLAPGRYTIRLSPPLRALVSPATVRVPESGRIWLRLSVTS